MLLDYDSLIFVVKNGDYVVMLPFGLEFADPGYTDPRMFSVFKKYDTNSKHEGWSACKSSLAYPSVTYKTRREACVAHVKTVEITKRIAP